MSFGFGIGDFVTIAQVSKLTWDTFTAVKHAPKEWRALESEVQSLAISLKSLDDTDTTLSIVQYTKNNPQREQNLTDLLTNSTNALAPMKALIEKYRVRDVDEKREIRDWLAGARFTMKSMSVQEFRNKLSLHTAGLNIFLTSISNTSLGRLEQLILNMQKAPHAGVNVATGGTSDNVVPDDGFAGVWSAIGRDLALGNADKNRVAREVVKFREEIRDYVQFILSRGVPYSRHELADRLRPPPKTRPQQPKFSYAPHNPGDASTYYSEPTPSSQSPTFQYPAPYSLKPPEETELKALVDAMTSFDGTVLPASGDEEGEDESKWLAPYPLTTAGGPPVGDRGLPSPSNNTPQVVSKDYANTGPLSLELSAPIVLPEYSPGPRMTATSNVPLPMPVKFEPSRPVYTPFRYNEGSQNQSDQLEAQRLGYKDYASKRKTYNSSRLMANAVKLSAVDLNHVLSPMSAKKVQEETFLGLLRSHSTVQPKNKLMNGPNSIQPKTTPPSSRMGLNLTKDAVRALRTSLPPTLPEKPRNGRVVQLRQRMEAFVDDFSFIQDTVIPWDRDNKEERKRLDEERHRRQEEFETRLDELFWNNEISYAELRDRETEFKLAEAERRCEEDKQELESFTQGVYNVVTSRIQHQVDDLNKEYVLAIDLLDLESDPASRMLKGDTGRSSMSEAMNVVLQLFEKLNIRYHKLAEARFEHEQRRNRLELSVLYKNGDPEVTKKLEKEFSTIEKLQMLHEARDKDQRTSELMETFERATVRALGDNQVYLEDLFTKIKALDNVLPADGAWQQRANETLYGENGARMALTTAQAVMDFVRQDSRALLSASNMADKILNDADYALSVAEAKVTSATDTIHGKLKVDKEKEDEKLLEDMRMRMDSIMKTPTDAASLIQKIVDRISYV